MDGNFHLSKMSKNCNAKDHSIWRGSSCLNKRELIEEHLEAFGADLSEVRPLSVNVKLNDLTVQFRKVHAQNSTPSRTRTV